MIRKLKSTKVYENKWMSVREDRVAFDNGFEGVYSVVDKSDCVMIIPYDGISYYLVKQYRYPIEKYFIEFPAGSHEESALESEAQLVKDELAEETGLISGKITKLGILNEVPATINQQCHMFLAESLIVGKQNLEITESDLTIIRLTEDELELAILKGEISDAKTLAGYLLLKLTRSEHER